LRITLAMAGFSASQLEVLVDDRQLIINGRREGDTSGDGAGESARAFLHRGIAARGFQRAFVLADGMKISAPRLNMACCMWMWPGPTTRPVSIPIKTAR